MNSYFKKGATVLFQGDSITDCGRNRSDMFSLGSGYPSKIASIYNTLFPESEVKFINKGVSGDRVHNLIERIPEDIYDIEPDFLSILVGINDVWRIIDSNENATIEEFKDHYEYLLKYLRDRFPNTKIMLMEPFVLHALPDRKDWHTLLDTRIQVVREMASLYADFYLPLDGTFASHCVNGTSPSKFAGDGVHPTDMGHSIIANEYLKALNII